MVEHARDGSNHPCPAELARAAWIFDHGFLPLAGGLDDQEPGELDRLRRLWNIFRAEWLWRHKGDMNPAEWVTRYPSEWEIVQDVMEWEDASSC